MLCIIFLLYPLYLAYIVSHRPLLFIIYINDLAEASNMFDFIIYADDILLSTTLDITKMVTTVILKI